MTLLAKRYASALFTLAKEKGAADAVAADLAVLHGELHAPGAAELISSPDVPADERAKVLAKLTDGRHELLVNLVGVLQHRRRLEVLACRRGPGPGRRRPEPRGSASAVRERMRVLTNKRKRLRRYE